MCFSWVIQLISSDHQRSPRSKRLRTTYLRPGSVKVIICFLFMHCNRLKWHIYLWIACVILHENECQVLKNKIRDFRKMTERTPYHLDGYSKTYSCTFVRTLKVGNIFIQNSKLQTMFDKAVQKRWNREARTKTKLHRNDGKIDDSIKNVMEILQSRWAEKNCTWI